MDVCIIDEDFTIDVVEDPEECPDESYFLSLIQKPNMVMKEIRPGEESRKETVSVNNTPKKIAPITQKTSTIIPKEQAQSNCKDNNKSINKDKSSKSRFLRKCKECGYYTSNLPSFLEHVAAHSNPRNQLYSCKHCDYASFNKIVLRNHSNSHLARKFQCPHCNFKGVKHKHLRVHIINKHTKRKTYKCAFCTFLTESKAAYGEHRNKVHNKHLRCSICGFWAASKADKVTHKKQHPSTKFRLGKIYKCDHCSYETLHKGNLTEHRVKHVENALEN